MTIGPPYPRLLRSLREKRWPLLRLVADARGLSKVELVRQDG